MLILCALRKWLDFVPLLRDIHNQIYKIDEAAPSNDTFSLHIYDPDLIGCATAD